MTDLIAKNFKLDLLNLLRIYLTDVNQLQAPSFSVFKGIWLDLGLSEVVTIRRPNVTYEEIIHCLYKVVLGVLSALEEFAADQEVRQLVDWATNEPESFHLNTAVGGIYSLYCLHTCQAEHPKVAVRLAPDEQGLLTGIVDRCRVKNYTEPLAIVRHLQQLGAFALTAAPKTLDFINESNISGQLYPGFGVMELSAGLPGADAATIREVKYHLSATLDKFGTKSLSDECDEYRVRLTQLWQASTANPSALPPDSVTDIDLGRVLHDYALEKADESRDILNRGKQVAPKQDAETASTTRVRPQANIEAIETGDVPGLPAAARRVILKEQARQQDIEARAKPWAEQLLPSGGGFATQVEDMPEVLMHL